MKIKEGILTEFLENEEVIEMWALDRDYDTEIEIIREQELEAAEERGEARGIAIGEERGIFKTVAELCFEGIISEEMAADKLQVSLEEFHSKFEEYKLNI